jgi:hypothetical protein
MNITKEIWKSGKEEMEKLLQYVEEIGLYNGIWSKHRKKRRWKKKKKKWLTPKVEKRIRMIPEPRIQKKRGKTYVINNY